MILQASASHLAGSPQVDGDIGPISQQVPPFKPVVGGMVDKPDVESVLLRKISDLLYKTGHLLCGGGAGVEGLERVQQQPFEVVPVQTALYHMPMGGGSAWPPLVSILSERRNASVTNASMTTSGGFVHYCKSLPAGCSNLHQDKSDL